MEELTIGQRIAYKRKELGLSQIALGEKMGVSRQSISKWEADAAIPEIDKLIALSKLFDVSVGWLLGVEGNAEPVQQPEPDFSDREWEIIDRLIQDRPAIPKWLMPAVAACGAVSLLAAILGGVALHRIKGYERDAAALSQTLSQTISGLPGIGEMMSKDVLSSYEFSVIPDAGMERFTFTFMAFPLVYRETDTAELAIHIDGEEFIRQACEWNGSRYETTFDLEARNGYSATLYLTSENGFVRSIPLFDACVSHLLSATTFGDVRVDYEGRDYKDATLIVSGLYFYIDLPAVYRDLSDPWTKCDLVVLADGVEVGRLDVLNRSPYSRQVNFMDSNFVEFTSQQQTIEVGELEEGQILELRLEGAFTTGLTLEKTIATWKHQDG